MPTSDGEATLEDLVRWLALPLEGREPIFSHESLTGDLTPVGREIAFGGSLRALFRQVVGAGTDPAPGVWKECPTCLRWYVDSLDPGVRRC